MQPITLMSSRGVTGSMHQSPGTMLPPVVTSRLAPVLTSGLMDNRTIQFVPQGERFVQHFIRPLDPTMFPGGIPDVRRPEMLSPGYVAVPMASEAEESDPLATWGRLGWGTLLLRSFTYGAISYGIAKLFGEQWTDRKESDWYMSPKLWGVTGTMLELSYRAGSRLEYERSHQ